MGYKSQNDFCLVQIGRDISLRNEYLVRSGYSVWVDKFCSHHTIDSHTLSCRKSSKYDELITYNFHKNKNKKQEAILNTKGFLEGGSRFRFDSMFKVQIPSSFTPGFACLLKIEIQK